MNLTNPNQKGTLGEIAVCLDLTKLGYEVFFPLSNHSKVDLIVIDENFQTYKIQVKATNSIDGVIEIYSVKNCLNPKYNSKYQENQIDIFAVYVINKEIIFYISAKELLKNSKSSKFRFSRPKNGQIKNVRFVENYLDFKKALRDCTPHVQTVSAVDDGTVQTTTLKSLAVGESRSSK